MALNTQRELDAAAEAVIEKATKLLSLARNNPNEHEAQSAMAAAQRLLEAHNLDMALIERRSGSGAAPRSDKSRGGGLYKWQRSIWKATAKLNFCHYEAIKGLTKGAKYENRIIGRKENVLATEIMAEYLQTTIEKLAAEWAKERGYNSRFVTEAIQYREGMGERITQRLEQLREERLAEDKRKQREAEAAARHPANAGGGTALVLASVIQDEEDLNHDYVYHLEPGTTGRLRAERVARQAAAHAEYEARIADAALFEAILAAFDPDQWRERDAAKQAEAARKKAEDDKWLADYYKRQARRRQTPTRERWTKEDQRRASHAFRAGERRGEDVSLDSQIDHDEKKALK